MAKRKSFADFIERMLLPVILGLAAGVSGGMVAYAYFTINLNQLAPTTTIGRVTGAVTAPLPESALAERLEALVLPVFKASSAGTGEFAARTLHPEDAIGFATALTSDGWLMTHEDVASGQILIGSDGALKKPTRIVRDARTGVVFLKIENGPLRVADFEETEHLDEGVPLFAVNGATGFVRTSFGGARLREGLLVSDSDAFNRVFTLQDAFGKDAFGSAVLTLGGNLAGIVTPEGFVPVHLIRPVLSDAFRGSEIIRASLGLRYLDLADAYVAGDPAEAKFGTRVTGSLYRGLSAVRSGSAAAEAGFREGDVILRIEDVEMSGNRDTAELVAEYRPGNRIDVEILREGARRVLEVVLR